MMCKRFHPIGVLFIAAVCQAVRITNINVPDTYTIDTSKNHSENLVLDCNYELQPNETGFVLKWIFNELPIYQWIPNQKPHALTVMKGLLDVSYAVSSETQFKYKAILITNPSWNLTGQYTCHVQTFQSSDRRSAKLQVVVPETNLELKHTTDGQGNLNIRCKVFDIFPEPKIVIELNGVFLTHSTNSKPQKSLRGLYGLDVQQKVQISKIPCPTTIRCSLTLPGTNYTRREEAIFYDKLALTSRSMKKNEIYY